MPQERLLNLTYLVQGPRIIDLATFPETKDKGHRPSGVAKESEPPSDTQNIQSGRHTTGLH